MKSNSLCEKITYKKVAIVLSVLFFISLIPLIYCFFFDYATGDDLWSGANVYQAIVNDKGFFGIVQALMDWVREDYNGWEGNWSSSILWGLQPSILGERAYCLTPWTALVVLLAGISYFVFYILKKYAGTDVWFNLIVSLIVIFFTVQYAPSIKANIFWHSGMVNYTLPYGLCLASFVWCDKFIHTGKWKYFIMDSLFLAYLGGAGYVSILFTFEMMILWLLGYMLCKDKEKKKRSLWLLIPFVLLMIGFVFNATAPGNSVRGGTGFGLDITKIFTTILACIIQGFTGGIRTFLTVRPLCLAAPLIFLMAWEKLDVENSKISFEHPVFSVGLLYLIYCSIYAPQIYTDFEVSGGVPNTIFYILLLAYVFSVIYLAGWLKKMYQKRACKFVKEEFLHKLRAAVVVMEVLLCVVAGRYLIGDMAAKICSDYISSGQLEDFEFQMQERLAILHDPEIEEVILPQMNDQQGPFMHMPLMQEPDAYTNKATARFYGKKSVVAIPRDEYYEIYGYPKEKE